VDTVSRLLSDEQKRVRFGNAKKLLKLCPKYTKKTFDNLVIGNEIWVYHFEPNRTSWSSNRVWASENAKRPSIAKTCKSQKTTNREECLVYYFSLTIKVMSCQRAKQLKVASTKMLSKH
jgi:hypothetical protein